MIKEIEIIEGESQIVEQKLEVIRLKVNEVIKYLNELENKK